MNIPFSPPFVNQEVKNEVLDALESGWITTGPKTKALEDLIAQEYDIPKVLCINSWTSGAMLMLKWFGVGPGDEVIVPAYTYAATALAVIHVGAKPIMVDVGTDFNMDVKAVEKAITSKTKAVIPVDIAGYPCDYERINALVRNRKNLFVATSEEQRTLGRILVISDAAHSIGTSINDRAAGTFTDVTIFSLHAVKNVTTAEGGAICLNFTEFDNQELYSKLRCYALNGQTKDAFTKSQKGAWEYDIIYPGLKINMPDVLAAIGLAQMRSYTRDILPQRRRIFETYNDFFKTRSWAILPPYKADGKFSCGHLYALRIRNADEQQRNEIIRQIAENDVAVNVHFKPLPLLGLFRDLGYRIADYPTAYAQFANEISLPIYPQLSPEQVAYVTRSVEQAVQSVLQ